MPGPQPRLHLPYARWPAADRMLWERAMSSDDDPFADTPGARLSKASLHNYFFAWRRWLGFLAIHEPTALEIAPAERLTIERVRAFAKHLAETNTPISVAGTVAAVYHAARVMMPEQDWTWLKAVKVRLYRAVPSSTAKGPVITSDQLRELGEQPEELGRIIDRVRSQSPVPVTTAENWHVFVVHPELAEHIDILFAHIIPYWEGLSERRAIEGSFNMYD